MSVFKACGTEDVLLSGRAAANPMLADAVPHPHMQSSANDNSSAIFLFIGMPPFLFQGSPKGFQFPYFFRRTVLSPMSRKHAHILQPQEIQKIALERE